VLDGQDLIGDPTEGALIVLAAKGGLDVEETRTSYPRVAEVPFDSDYKFMATFHEMTGAGGERVVRCYVKGAPDVLISRGAPTGIRTGRWWRSPTRTAIWPWRPTTALLPRASG
jgi:Ca2+-transporting ATPase